MLIIITYHIWVIQTLNINKRRHNVPRGVDEMLVEHLYYGLSAVLCTLLVSLFNTILSDNYLPSCICDDIIFRC